MQTLIRPRSVSRKPKQSPGARFWSPLWLGWGLCLEGSAQRGWRGRGWRGRGRRAWGTDVASWAEPSFVIPGPCAGPTRVSWGRSAQLPPRGGQEPRLRSKPLVPSQDSVQPPQPPGPPASFTLLPHACGPKAQSCSPPTPQELRLCTSSRRAPPRSGAPASVPVFGSLQCTPFQLSPCRVARGSPASQLPGGTRGPTAVPFFL